MKIKIFSIFLSSWIKILRPQFWILSIIPGIVGVYLSAGRFPIVTIIIVAIILAVGSSLAEFVNSYVDRKIDIYQKTKSIKGIVFSGGSGLPRNYIFDGKLFIKIFILLIFIIITLSRTINANVMIISIAGIFLAIGYSKEPMNFKSRGLLGNLDMAIGRGFISFHVGWLTFSSITSTSIFIGVFLTLLVIGTSLLPHLADYIEDKKANIKTFPVLVGFENATILGSSMIIFSFIFLLILKNYSFVNLNYLFIPLIVIGIILSIMMLFIKPATVALITRLQILGMLLFIIAPFIFI